MKKVLIISYYYPPNNNIPSWRPFSWANYFSGAEMDNTEVHVITRFWDGSEIKWEDQVNPSEKEHTHIHRYSDRHIVHYLAINSTRKKIAKTAGKFFLFNKANYFISNLLGWHHMEVDADFSFGTYILKNFPKGFFDTVLVTSPPLNSIRLGYRLRRWFPNAFFVADFRDLWDNEELRINYTPGRKAKFYNSLFKASIKKWLNRYDLVTGVSLPLAKKVGELRKNMPVEVITNGFESELFKTREKIQSPDFTIASIGSIYPAQNVRVLAEGIIAFAKKNGFKNISVQFIGVKATNDSLHKEFEGQLPKEMLTVTERVGREEALRLLKNAHVLIYPAWAGYQGIYSGKMFEYLASGNNILIAPSDSNVLEDLMKETKAGVTKNTGEEVALQLQQWYDEWRSKGFVTYNGLPDKISQYSRENQAAKLAHLIEKFRDHKIAN